MAGLLVEVRSLWELISAALSERGPTGVLMGGPPGSAPGRGAAGGYAGMGSGVVFRYMSFGMKQTQYWSGKFRLLMEHTFHVIFHNSTVHFDMDKALQVDKLKRERGEKDINCDVG